MSSVFDNLCCPGKPLKAEPPDAREYVGLQRSGRCEGLALESRFGLAHNAAHALCLAALGRHGYRPGNRYIVF